MRKRQLPYDVVTAAKIRLRNVFSNGLRVYLSLSGGKDSIVCANLVYEMIQDGEIDPAQVTVIFVDEEAVFDEVDRIVKQWRKKFMLVGVEFRWYCIEVKHFNCFNSLSNDETFICWDHLKRDSWVRPMPKFAITDHPRLQRRIDTYQEFLSRVTADGVSMAGMRTAESLTRKKAFNQKWSLGGLFSPIYDWLDPDVWQYIKDKDLDFPETYLQLFQVGRSMTKLRISQFFSIDTARTLVQMSEFDPDLMDKITKREPNAYLATLYWDTEMFRSSGGAGEAGHDKDGKVKDHRKEVLHMIASPEWIKNNPTRVKERGYARSFVMAFGDELSDGEWKKVHGMLVAGDPKGRTGRTLGPSHLFLRAKREQLRLGSDVVTDLKPTSRRSPQTPTSEKTHEPA